MRKSKQTKRTEQPYVVVRTHSAGVHMGRLVNHYGTTVVLADSSRLWRWEGANTLNEVSLHGVGEASRISEQVKVITLTEAIEIIPCTAKATKNLQRPRWA